MEFKELIGTPVIDLEAEWAKRVPLISEHEISELVDMPPIRMAWPFPKMREFAIDLRAAREELRQMKADRDSLKQLSQIQYAAEVRWAKRVDKLETAMRKIEALNPRNDFSAFDALEIAKKCLESEV